MIAWTHYRQLSTSGVRTTIQSERKAEGIAKRKHLCRRFWKAGNYKNKNVYELFNKSDNFKLPGEVETSST